MKHEKCILARFPSIAEVDSNEWIWSRPKPTGKPQHSGLREENTSLPLVGFGIFFWSVTSSKFYPWAGPSTATEVLG